MDILSGLNEIPPQKLTIVGICLAVLFIVLLKIGVGILKKVILLAIFAGVAGFFLFARG